MAEVSQRFMARGMASRLEAAGPKRVSNSWLSGITVAATLAVGFTIGLIPWVGSAVAGAVTHVIERVSNGIKARRELDSRADWYRNQIATTLGMRPEKVKAKHLEQAAAINPMLAAVVKDVRSEQAHENKTSMAINATAAMIPGGTGVAHAAGAVKAVATGTKFAAGALHMGKSLVAVTGVGMLSSWLHEDKLTAQKVAEDINSQLIAAEAKGVDPKTVITPAMLFTMRVSQDEKLYAEIKQNFGKPFHQLTEQKQAQVMQTYGALANATAAEAHAIANRMLPVQELMARQPNLNGTSRYVMGQQASGFANRIAAERQNNVAIMRGNAANDPSFTATEDARRIAAAQALDARQA